jgi:FkbM family methyltransferase
VFFDVGAHIGEYTLLAAARGATVHAFEPNPANAAFLRANVASNGLTNVTVHEAAVSDRECHVRFLAHRDPSLSAIWTGRQTDGGYSEITVRAIALDSVAVPRVDVIKIDAEGAELAVLRGARAILARPPKVAPVVVFEFAPANYARFDFAPPEIVDFLTRHGYCIARLDGTPFDAWPAQPSVVNLVASKLPIASLPEL